MEVRRTGKKAHSELIAAPRGWRQSGREVFRVDIDDVRQTEGLAMFMREIKAVRAVPHLLV